MKPQTDFSKICLLLLLWRNIPVSSSIDKNECCAKITKRIFRCHYANDIFEQS